MKLKSNYKQYKLNRKSFLVLLCLICICPLSIFAQDTGLNFQGVARNTNGVILASQQISFRFSILKISPTGNPEYIETRTVNTNSQGIFSIVIGDSSANSNLGTYANIDWKTMPKYLKVEMDPNAGNNYILMGTTQLQSVPYSNYSQFSAIAGSIDANNIIGLIPVARGGTGVSDLISLKKNLNLDKINNTSDSVKPISNATKLALDKKINLADSNTTFVTPFKLSSIIFDTISLSNRINLRATTNDLNLKLNKEDTLSLSNRINLKVNTTDLDISLLTKENNINKSSAVDLGGANPSDILYPTQKAVKVFITANQSSGGISDGGITTIKLADEAVTDAKISNGINKNKVGLSNVENTALSTWKGTNNIEIVGTITTGVWSGTVIGSNVGGAGTINGLMKANGSGIVNMAVPGTDYIAPNASIVSATKTKITYDEKGLITGGTDATTADIAPSSNRNYVTDVQAGVLSNTSGTNTGDETICSIQTKLGITTLSGSNTGDQTIILTGDITGTGTGTLTSTLVNTGVIEGSYGSGSAIPTFRVDSKGRLTIANTASVIADAGTLSGTSLNSSITGSSLTSVGTISSGTWSGTVIAIANGGTGSTIQNFVDLSTNQEINGSKIFNSNDGLMATGNFGSGNSISLGLGNRMMWYPKKSAFRVGYHDMTDDMIGIYTFSSGYNTKATGFYSSAINFNTNASGLMSFATGNGSESRGGFSSAFGLQSLAIGAGSVAFGNNTQAFGDFSTSMGINTNAIGDFAFAAGGNTEAQSDYSTAIGLNTLSSGLNSFASGHGTKALSYSETVVGTYNTTYIPTSTSNFATTDRIFVIGNGVDENNLSDALIVKKNGDTKINGILSVNKILSGDIIYPNQKPIITGINNDPIQILTGNTSDGELLFKDLYDINSSLFDDKASLSAAQNTFQGDIKAKTYILSNPNSVTASTINTDIDLSVGNVLEIILEANTTLNFLNPRIGTYIIKIKQNATGGKTLTFPTIKWADNIAPIITTTANKIDLLTLIYDGTNYYGSCLQNF